MIVQNPCDGFVTERALSFHRYLISSNVGQCNAFAAELSLDDHAINALPRQDNVVSDPIGGSLIRTGALFGLNEGHLSDAFANRTSGAGIVAMFHFLGHTAKKGTIRTKRAGARPLELMTVVLREAHAR